MDTTVIQRVKEIIQLKCNGNGSHYSRLIGMNQVSISDMCTGKTKANLALVEKTLNTFEEISAEWLLRGEGEMLKPSYSGGGVNKIESAFMCGDGNETCERCVETHGNIRFSIFDPSKDHTYYCCNCWSNCSCKEDRTKLW